MARKKAGSQTKAVSKLSKGESVLPTGEHSIAESVKVIKETEREVGKSAFIIGAELCNIREKGREKWREHFGNHVETLEDCFNEIGYAPASGYNFIKIYERFNKYITANPDYLAISYSKYVRLLPIMHKDDGSEVDDDTALEYLESALNLPTEREVKMFVRDVQGKNTSKTCGHPSEAIQTHHKCGLCHTWID